jgi:hypothetical protein
MEHSPSLSSTNEIVEPFPAFEATCFVLCVDLEDPALALSACFVKKL